jgi:replicative DNA helicase
MGITQEIPHSIEAEEAVNGSLLLGAELPDLLPDDFHSEQNGYVFKACIDLNKKGVSINQITVGNQLKEMGKLDTVGVSYLSHLLTVTPTHLDCEYYAEIVKRDSIRRQMIWLGDKISKLSQNGDITESLTEADNLLLELRKKSNLNDIITPEDRIKMASDRYTMLYEKEGGAAISTGLRDLDRHLGGGLYPELYIVAARPSMGKTTFMQFISNSIADRGLTVAFISAEMDADGLMDRDIAAVVGVPTQEIRYGKYTDKVYTDILGKGLERIGQRKIYCLDSPPITTGKIAQFCFNVQSRHGLDAVFIDYLGLLDDSCRENQNIRLGQISRRLKALQMKLGVPVITAHQLNRGVEHREDKEPSLSDIRESGHIEEDADTVLMLFRDSYYTDTTDLTTKIKIAKQRQGDAGLIVRVLYDKKNQTYKDLRGD